MTGSSTARRVWLWSVLAVLGHLGGAGLTIAGCAMGDCVAGVCLCCAGAAAILAGLVAAVTAVRVRFG